MKKIPLARRLITPSAIHAASDLVSGDGERVSRTSIQIAKENSAALKMTRRLFLLSIFLAAVLVVSLAACVLTTAKTQVKTSLAVTLISAVTAIVTSWVLSIGKRLFKRSISETSERVP